MNAEALASGRAIVEAGELAVSTDPAVSLHAYGLGASLAVVAIDPARPIAGLLHVMLPLNEGGQSPAAMWASSGVPLLFERLRAAGAELASLKLALVGGADLLGAGDLSIGARNLQVAAGVLQAHGVPRFVHEAGGHRVRSVRVEIGAGRIRVKVGGEERDL